MKEIAQKLITLLAGKNDKAAENIVEHELTQGYYSVVMYDKVDNTVYVLAFNRYEQAYWEVTIEIGEYATLRHYPLQKEEFISQKRDFIKEAE